MIDYTVRKPRRCLRPGPADSIIGHPDHQEQCKAEYEQSGDCNWLLLDLVGLLGSGGVRGIRDLRSYKTRRHLGNHIA
jgi:hypothetical protein